MHKLYLNNFNGQNPSAWEGNWQGVDILGPMTYAAYNNPYKIDFDKFCLPRKKVIDAGCGMGGFVTYYAKEGCDIIGIDFARDTVDRLRSRIKGIPVEHGSIENISYADNTFDVYLSIGVIEHFEKGPDVALKEAYRVLKPDGYLIFTVPYLNPCKKAKHKIDVLTQKPLKRNGLLNFDNNCRYKKVMDFIEEEGKDFHQYAFAKDEVRRFVSRNGFEIAYMHGCSIIYGVSHVPFAGGLMRRFIKAFSNSSNSAGPENGIKDEETRFDSLRIPAYTRQGYIRELIKDVAIRENTKRPMFRPLIKVLQSLCGDFMLVVCKAAK